MFARAYRKLKTRLDHLREDRSKGRVSTLFYLLQLVGLRILIQLIVTPHFLALGPFKTFTTLARRDETGSWIDSYNDFVISNRITVTGLLLVALVGLVALLVFIYLPVLYL